MTTDNVLCKAKLFFAGLLLLLLALVIACSKGEEPSKKTSGPANNPYSSESVFEEVQHQLQKNPNDTDALFHLADLYERSSLYKEAIDTYKKILKIKPNSGYIYFKIGTAYDRINQPSEAVTAFQSAIKYMPTNAVLYNNMGVAYGKLKKPGEEIAALKKAIKLRPRYTSARYNLGITYLKIGNKKEALKEYETLKDFDEGAAETLKKEIDEAH